MNTFRTLLSFPSANFEITHKDKILSIGSCFAENIGQKLNNRKFQIVSNPFGILYNPLSIAKSLTLLKDGKPYQANELFKHRDIWYSFEHHSEFAATIQDDALQKINTRLKTGHEHFLNSQVLLITLGTAFTYFLKSSDEPVANCHKLPANHFEKKLLSVKEIQEAFNDYFTAILVQNPTLKIIFTISPVRHFRDGMLDNQLSKSTLRLAIDNLEKTYENVHYFPAYELMLDDLRDYRFYEADMLHPNSTAIQYIWERFSSTFFNKKTIENIKKFEQLRKAFAHRPFQPNTAEHQRFLEKHATLTLQYQKEFTNLNFEKELSYFEKQKNGKPNE